MYPRFEGVDLYGVPSTQVQGGVNSPQSGGVGSVNAPVVPDMGQGQGGGVGSGGGGSNYYDDQQAFYRSISEGGPTSSTGQINPNRRDKYTRDSFCCFVSNNFILFIDSIIYL